MLPRAAMSDFAKHLVLATTILGTVLDVAVLLGVDAAQVERWIAGVDSPTHERSGELLARLRLFVMACAA